MMKKTLCILMTVALLGTTACSVDISFDAKEGDGMYLSPEDRVAVW